MNAKILENDTHSDLDTNSDIKSDVREYYGETLQGTSDLQTNACCDIDTMPRYIKDYLSDIHDEVLMRYYGCGLVAPELLEGTSILDLGCGTGRDVYLLSRLAGESGKVIGVDMTQNLILNSCKVTSKN